MAAAVAFDTPVDKGRTVAFPNYVRRGTLSLGIYATGGVAVTKSLFDLPVSLDELDLGNTVGLVAEWDKTNGKVIVYWQVDADNGTALGEVTDTTDLSLMLFRFRAVGR